MLVYGVLPPLLILALLLLVIGAVRRISLWRAGQPASVNIVAGLFAIPRRYLVDLHHVVERDRYMSTTHVVTAGGFVLAMLLIIVVYLIGINHRYLNSALLCVTALMFVGAMLVRRRRIDPPARLSKGPWQRLSKSLAVFSASFFLLTLLSSDWLGPMLSDSILFEIITAILLVGVVAGLAEMLVGMGWGGPMKHAFAGALHLAFHRRSERFGGGRSTDLRAIELDADVLGVARPIDFTWNQLLGFDACVQCGRCEAVCPAFAAGQPLNPKKLIQDMVVGLAGGSDANYSGSGYPGVDIGNAEGGPNKIITQGLVAADTLWSCTTCRACVEECPMMIEHVDAVVDMRRFLTLEKGQTPEKAAEVIENLIATDNPNGFPPSHRAHWSADKNLRLMSDVKRVDVLFWVGDGAFDMRSQRILAAFVKLMQAAKVDFAILGDEECDSGDVARRLGDEATFQQLAKRNIKILKQYRFNRIVTTDPHAFHVLNNEYGELGGNYEVVHHSRLLNELVASNRLKLDKFAVDTKVTYHDPCYLGRYNGEYDAPRELIQRMGIDLVEMERSGYRSRCCGGGGGAPITDIPGKRRIADMRMQDVIATNAEIVAVGCQQCTAMLEGVVEPRPRVMDIAEIMVSVLREEGLH